MNIKELMNILSQFDPETRVIVAGYEGGFNDISEVKEMSILLNVHREWYMGYMINLVMNIRKYYLILLK
jgi:hypothetical protein